MDLGIPDTNENPNSVHHRIPFLHAYATAAVEVKIYQVKTICKLQSFPVRIEYGTRALGREKFNSYDVIDCEVKHLLMVVVGDFYVFNMDPEQF